MRLRWIGCTLFLVGLLTATALAGEPPLALHPDNPHYFLFRGRPTILIASGEHYGAVLNSDFDYIKYLDEIHATGLNLTRTFSGSYREVPGSFGIVHNTLAPTPDHFVSPWPRGTTVGAGDGLNKFDLSKWNPAYFTRLKDFVAQAGKRGIVVEMVLFCAIYDDKLWTANPMNPANNTNGFGKVSRHEVYTLKDQKLLAAQEALVNKIVVELKDADNVYYEICNEPWAGNVAPEWSDRIAATIAAAERQFPHQHLIAQNISNGSAEIKDPNPRVSIFNFHYATPDALRLNRKLDHPIADDETGFKGKEDLPYRAEAWEFLLSGGALVSHLDYSFTAKKSDGSAVVTTSPGGGGKPLRSQLKILKDFLDSFDFLRMAPANSVIVGGLPPMATARALVSPGKAYAIYLHGGTQANLVVQLPEGHYHVEWINPKTGAAEKKSDPRHPGGGATIESPHYADDMALRLLRVE